MAHHQQTSHDRRRAAQGFSSLLAGHAGPMSLVSEDEAITELDEPPDPPLYFPKKKTSDGGTPLSDTDPIVSPCYRKASLLTQALLTSPEIAPTSDGEAPHLTSDGGLTSPTRTTTPSPPLPATYYAGLPSPESKELIAPIVDQTLASTQTSAVLGIDRTQEVKVEETLGRRRCISFACAKKASTQDKPVQEAKTPETPKEGASSSTAIPPKRPCMLRFACPMKPPQGRSQEIQKPSKAPEVRQEAHSLASARKVTSACSIKHAIQKDVNVTTETTTIKNPADSSISALTEGAPQQTSKAFNRIDFQKSEATSFHEFAGSYHTEDEWTNEQLAYRKRMTITDTLQKENAIRRLAEEADQEALEEDAELEDRCEDDGESDGLDVTDQISDDGNESDDEEGFAESDDESEAGYEFWTAKLTKAATSTECVERIRPSQQRVASESSIELAVKAEDSQSEAPTIQDKHKQRHRSQKVPLKQPVALFKSDEFIIGTLDEDRPLEDAYLSSLEQRKRLKHRLIPQDIDPSFPTSDPEAEDDGNQSEELHVDVTPLNQAEWITGRPESSEDELPRNRNPLNKSREQTPVPSPKRLHSPPPRRLFGQTTHRLRSPPPPHRKLTSPPSSRRPSFTQSPPTKPHGIETPYLAQRPNLTHTTSLPRTPNPFWALHRKARARGLESPSVGPSVKAGDRIQAEFHSRGPIDIVQGLENKRQRRKEKFWRIHCQKAHAGKEKERKCQPGKGAERMREVGKEMQDRLRGYGHRANLVLSI